MIGHNMTHLTMLASRGWLMLILVPLVKLVVWQEHPREEMQLENPLRDYSKWDLISKPLIFVPEDVCMKSFFVFISQSHHRIIQFYV